MALVTLNPDNLRELKSHLDSHNAGIHYRIEIDRHQILLQSSAEEINCGNGWKATIEDNVNHPSHYNSGKIEVIEFIEDQKLPFDLGNTIKYIARAGKKDQKKTIEDLKKARWYLNRRIELCEAENELRDPKRPNEMNK